jgi:hypothetical protein
MLPMEATKKQTPMTISLWCSDRPSSIVRGNPAAHTTTIVIRAGWRGGGRKREGQIGERGEGKGRVKERRVRRERKRVREGVKAGG